MPSVWDAMRQDLPDESVVVIPSVTMARTVAASGAIIQAFEERFLFLLLLLRQPRLRMIYVTSMPINPRIVEYYLALLPGVIPSHALSRLTLVSTDDSSDRPLSEKVLARPRLLAKIAAQIPNRSRCHLLPYNTTSLERDIALTLGIPMYGADPDLADLGSKTGCRRLFAECEVPHPLGAEDLHSLEEVTDAIVEMLRDPARRSEQVIVKTNEGVSGSGNALVDLAGIAALADADRRAAIGERVRAMQLESSPRCRWTRTWPGSSRTAASSRSGSSVRSCSAPAFSSALARTAVSSCCPPMISCWAAPADRATSAACFPRTRRTPA